MKLKSFIEKKVWNEKNKKVVKKISEINWGNYIDWKKYLKS